MSAILAFIYKNAWLYVLVLSALALVIALYRLWRMRRQNYPLEKDKTGLYRYHKETQFKKKDAYCEILDCETTEAKPKDARKVKKSEKKVIAVITFKGDMRAREHTTLANLVDEIQVNRDKISEVVVCVNSPGGMVPHYGHAYSELERIRHLGIDLTVCIDVVAASGGYLMSLPANKIIAAPFALVGSIGVIAFVPNIRQLLLKHDINPRTFTAGRYKRTVTLTDDASPEEISRFQSQLESIHLLFSAAVTKYRQQVNLEQVITGEHWTAVESVEKGLGLVDELGTSHEYLLKKNEESDLVFLSQKKSFWEEGFGLFSSSVADRIAEQFSSYQLPF